MPVCHDDSHDPAPPRRGLVRGLLGCAALGLVPQRAQAGGAGKAGVTVVRIAFAWQFRDSEGAREVVVDSLERREAGGWTRGQSGMRLPDPAAVVAGVVRVDIVNPGPAHLDVDVMGSAPLDRSAGAAATWAMRTDVRVRDRATVRLPVVESPPPEAVHTPLAGPPVGGLLAVRPASG